MASPPAVVRILTTQNRKMISGTLAALGSGNTRLKTTTTYESFLLQVRGVDVTRSGVDAGPHETDLVGQDDHLHAVS